MKWEPKIKCVDSLSNNELFRRNSLAGMRSECVEIKFCVSVAKVF